MKSELEPKDIELIAQRVADLLWNSFPMGTKDGDDPFFTVESLADHLQVDPGWIYKQVALQNLLFMTTISRERVLGETAFSRLQT